MQGPFFLLIFALYFTFLIFDQKAKEWPIFTVFENCQILAVIDIFEFFPKI